MEDETRFRAILMDAIAKKECTEYKAFLNETEKKAKKRKAHYAKEAKEAEELKKEMGLGESQESLRMAILARQKKQASNFDGFLDNVSKKNFIERNPFNFFSKFKY